MRRVLLAVVLVGVVVAITVWRLPASFALAWLPPAVGAHLSVHSATGTLWRGEAELTSPWVPATLRLTWRCRLEAPVRLACALGDALLGDIRLSPGPGGQPRVEAESLAATLPLQVQLAGAPRLSIDRLHMEINALRFDRTQLVLNASATATNVLMPLAPLARGLVVSAERLREVVAECAPDGASTRCQIASRGDGATLRGRVELSPQRTRGEIDLNLPRLGRQRLAW